MSDQLNDGQVRTGSRALTLSNGFVYNTDSFSLDNPTTQIVRTDPRNVPDGALTTRGIITGSAPLNYANDTTPDPEIFQTFTEDGFLYAITQVSPVETKGAEKKCTINFYRVLNPTNYLVS